MESNSLSICRTAVTDPAISRANKGFAFIMSHGLSEVWDSGAKSVPGMFNIPQKFTSVLPSAAQVITTLERLEQEPPHES